MSELTSVIENLQELQRMHQLNLELLEQLGIFGEWILNNNNDIPNREKFQSLLHKTQALLRELYGSSLTKTLQYQKLADEKKHLFRTDEDVPVPSRAIVNHGRYRRWRVNRWSFVFGIICPRLDNFLCLSLGFIHRDRTIVAEERSRV